MSSTSVSRQVFILPNHPQGQKPTSSCDSSTDYPLPSYLLTCYGTSEHFRFVRPAEEYAVQCLRQFQHCTMPSTHLSPFHWSCRSLSPCPSSQTTWRYQSCSGRSFSSSAREPPCHPIL